MARHDGPEGSAPQTAAQIDHAARRMLLRAWHQAGWDAFRKRHIPRGALAYMRFCADWAFQFGDGDSFTLGDRWQAAETGFDRKTIRVYRRRLMAIGALEYREKWAHRRGWFYVSETRLNLACPTGGIFPGHWGKNSPGHWGKDSPIP